MRTVGIVDGMFNEKKKAHVAVTLCVRRERAHVEWCSVSLVVWCGLYYRSFYVRPIDMSHLGAFCFQVLLVFLCNGSQHRNPPNNC